jgi:transglutaminase-like putative cysteine protease
MKYRISHTTTYAYRDAVSLCQNVAHLAPRECGWQQSEPHMLSISPDPAVIEERIDYFGNPVQYFTVQEPHKELAVTVEHVIAVASRPLPEFTEPWEAIRDRLAADRSPEWLDAAQFAFASRFVPVEERYAEFAAESFTPGRPILEAALDLTQRIYSGFAYDPQATTLSTPVAEVLDTKRGVCQDFAHLQLAMLRSLGLAAQYVSGYLETIPAPGTERLAGADATHAWVRLFCGDAGWIDFDPTNGIIPGNRHIWLAWGRDYEDVCPLKGVILGGGAHSISVAVDVVALNEDAR